MLLKIKKLNKDNRNNYGHQPVYLGMEKASGKSHLVLLYNSNAMGKLLAKNLTIFNTKC
jgi:hypothetical protein